MACAAVVPAAAAESDFTCTREARPPVIMTAEAVAVLLETSVRKLEGETVDAESADVFIGGEVLVARIGPDGKPVLACVDSEEAARRFLLAPAGRLRGRAQEK
jgi:hypothetical protein